VLDRPGKRERGCEFAHGECDVALSFAVLITINLILSTAKGTPRHEQMQEIKFAAIDSISG
jgi:hypothetical protein